jgi:hypothetical protein
VRSWIELTKTFLEPHFVGGKTWGRGEEEQRAEISDLSGLLAG